jgi:hypothetical protein
MLNVVVLRVVWPSQQWVETIPSNICKHPYFPYGHPFMTPHGTTLSVFDTKSAGKIRMLDGLVSTHTLLTNNERA